MGVMAAIMEEGEKAGGIMVKITDCNGPVPMHP